MPYWIADTLAATPLFAWIFFGLGVPYALLLLPRPDWVRRAEVLALAFAVGPALLTAYMFGLSTLGVNYTRVNVLGGIVVLAMVGALWVWRKAQSATSPQIQGGETTAGRQAGFGVDGWLLIGLITVALIVRWVVIAYWPFTAYDSLWVYGYEGRLYALLGHIPTSIGYYPQFMPLQYAYAQLFFGINDHAARAGLIFLHVGSILAAYGLGSRLFNRRVGLLLAAIWALHPHLGEWSRAGDLEIPLAYLFTLAAAYYLTAWRSLNRRYALIAGAMLGIGLWIKPTMGAFLLGMALMGLFELLRVRFDFKRLLLRLQIALITGMAAVPLGAVWYFRNLLLGHNPVDFPSGFWQTLAAQSGVEFGWVLLALLLALVYLLTRRDRPNMALFLVGALLIVGALISTLLPYWALSLQAIFPDWLWLETWLAPARRLTTVEWAALFAGAGVIAGALWRYWRGRGLPESVAQLGWAAALALPYAVVWFFFYSYHYRLSFAVVPLLILPSAALLAMWIKPERMRRTFSVVYFVVLALLGVPGVVAAVYDTFGGWDYMQTDKYTDDVARYRSGNGALMSVVDGLQVWLDEHPGETLTVNAPGVDRLPFFFPLHNINVDEAPTRLSDVEDAAYLVYGLPETRGEYQNIPITDNQVIGALSRVDVARRAWGFDDGIFRYDVYEWSLDNRWIAPQPNGPETRAVVFGGIVRYLGYDIGSFYLGPQRRVIGHTYWQVLESAPQDLSLFMHLLDAQGNLITNWDNPIGRGERGYYSSQVWEAGEFLTDEREFPVSADSAQQWVGGPYRLVIGWYDPATNTRLPVVIEGVAAGDSHEIEARMEIHLD